MIKKILDFKNIDTRSGLGKYISTELKFSRVTELGSWDAYMNLFSEILYKEDEGVYRDSDGWISYQEYLNFIANDKAIGLKNEYGIRDDIELTFINFYPFCYKYEKLATEFLICTFHAKEKVKYGTFYDPSEWLNLEILIKS